MKFCMCDLQEHNIYLSIIIKFEIGNFYKLNSFIIANFIMHDFIKL